MVLCFATTPWLKSLHMHREAVTHSARLKWKYLNSGGIMPEKHWCEGAALLMAMLLTFLERFEGWYCWLGCWVSPCALASDWWVRVITGWLERGSVKCSHPPKALKVVSFWHYSENRAWLLGSSSKWHYSDGCPSKTARSPSMCGKDWRVVRRKLLHSSEELERLTEGHLSPVWSRCCSNLVAKHWKTLSGGALNA